MYHKGEYEYNGGPIIVMGDDYNNKGAVYAPLLLGYTDHCGMSYSSYWSQAVNIHSLLPPHKAFTTIQHIYWSYLHDKPYRQQAVESAFSFEAYKLEHNNMMALAMWDLEDSDNFV